MQREASWAAHRPALLRVGRICCSLAWRWVWLSFLARIFLHLDRPRSRRTGAVHGYHKIPRQDHRNLKNPSNVTGVQPITPLAGFKDHLCSQLLRCFDLTQMPTVAPSSIPTILSLPSLYNSRVYTPQYSPYSHERKGNN